MIKLSVLEVDKTNKEIKGYRQYNIQDIPKMTAFLIREY
jgi:hypothetical protein